MAICSVAGKGLKKTYKCPAVSKFSRISAKSLFLVLSIPSSFILELTSDQENKNGFGDEGLWFLGHRVDLTL